MWGGYLRRLSDGALDRQAGSRASHEGYLGILNSPAAVSKVRGSITDTATSDAKVKTSPEEGRRLGGRPSIARKYMRDFPSGLASHAASIKAQGYAQRSHREESAKQRRKEEEEENEGGGVSDSHGAFWS